MSNYVPFIDEEFSIDIKLPLEEETIWMTQKEIASVFGASQQAINKSILGILNNNNNFNDTCYNFKLIVLPDGRKYNTKIYNLEIIPQIICKVISKITSNIIYLIGNIINQYKGVNTYYE